MCFFDTNVLLYQYDASDPRKKSIADALIKRSLVRGEFLISTQVMTEFYNVASRRYTRQFSAPHLRQLMLELADCEPITLNPQMIVDAVLIHQTHSVSWWDSTIVSAALHAGAETLYSEDLQHGRDFDGLEIQNPFRIASTVNETQTPYSARRSR
jgi:predicted nucleic acid-binding protein